VCTVPLTTPQTVVVSARQNTKHQQILFRVTILERKEMWGYRKREDETFINNFKLQHTYRSKSELLVDGMIDIERITLPNTVGVRCVGGSWAVTFWRGGSIGRRIRVAQSA